MLCMVVECEICINLKIFPKSEKFTIYSTFSCSFWCSLVSMVVVQMPETFAPLWLAHRTHYRHSFAFLRCIQCTVSSADALNFAPPPATQPSDVPNPLYCQPWAWGTRLCLSLAISVCGTCRFLRNWTVQLQRIPTRILHRNACIVHALHWILLGQLYPKLKYKNCVIAPVKKWCSVLTIQLCWDIINDTLFGVWVFNCGVIISNKVALKQQKYYAIKWVGFMQG